ncbi:ABC transporter permease [Candidatus Daviesbacteria bacterium]|nr:ABC transporter permease [Candidatus Daviesbacteria bacterium]
MKIGDLVKRNIRRTPYQALAATMVMFLTFLTLLVFLLLALGSQEILKYYESKPQAIAFFKDNTTAEDVKAIENALKQSGTVTSLKFVSKEEALKIYQDRNKSNPTLLELVTANILPASLEISTSSPKDLGVLAAILKKEPVVEEVVYPEDVVAALTKATGVVRIIGLVSVSFLIIFASLVILMVIGFKIRLKRGEIETMKLLGASSWFIRAPFLLEGVAYGVIGALSAWIISYMTLWYFTPFLQGTLGEVKLLPVSWVMMLALLLISIMTAVLIGGLGSYGALRRYLKL